MSQQRAVARLCAALGFREPVLWQRYFELAETWSARINLTSATNADALAEILFVDAIELIKGKWLRPTSSLVDVGTGVGAPTIPLLLSDQSIRATLIEPRSKRASFLRTVVGSLDIAGRVTIVEDRIDPAGPSVPGAPFDVALSRATFGPAEWVRIGLRLAAEVWVFTADAELDAAPGHTPQRQLSYHVPSSGAPRSIVAYRGAA